jgi:hypothetical protein
MKEIKDMSIGELAAFVCTHLLENSIICTLSGGACVSIYSKNQYQSWDIDFIEMVTYSRKQIRDIMKEIGFDEVNRYFVHPDTKYFVEFPSGPLAIGSQPVKEVNYIEFTTGTLRILTPTDCVKDRLSAYYFWDDLQSLEQAIMVANEYIIDLDDINNWSESEGMTAKFEVFKKRITSR